MKLYELDWALYPRRVGIYMAEKGITDIERIALDALDPGTASVMARLSPQRTVPALQTDDGKVIGSSIAILEYLEERYPSPDMLGDTPEERARTRELVAVIDEATTQLGIWCHKASPIFAEREVQNLQAAGFAADAYHKQLRLLDTMMRNGGGPFLAGPRVTIADCIAMATLQFAEEFYGVPIPGHYAVLTEWRARFAARPSARSPTYPEPLLALTRGLPLICPATSV